MGRKVNFKQWMMVGVAITTFLAASQTATVTASDTRIRIPRKPAISPDGNRLAFAWQNDIWTAGIDGGSAKRVTIHAATDDAPYFSPDGKQLYFSSDRSGRDQIYSMPVEGGAAKQITFDSNRKTIHGITGDGRYLVISQSTDRGWHYSESSRVFLLDTLGEEPKKMLFDAGVRDAALSPDGTKVLFVRGRSNWNRKGYQGSQAAQLWLADLSTDPVTLTRLSKDREHFQNVAEMDPMWAPDGKSYYFSSDPEGVFNIYQRSLDSDDARQVTNVASDGVDDGVAFPVLARNGNTLLMRRGFDLVKSDPQSGKIEVIELSTSGDRIADPIERKRQTQATTVAFTPDGKQMAFVAGEDIYVMDRILKEPVQVTKTAHPETSLLFSSDGSRLFYVTDSGGEMDIWEATHSQEDGIWWMAKEFKLRQVTNDRDVEGRLELSPSGSHVAYTKGSNLFVMDDDGTDHRQVAKMWSPPSFDWAPDGKWLTYASQDDDYNSDVFLVPIDGTREPFNLSRHPDMDGSPVWSGDGKRIAWVGRRDGEEVDIYVVELAKSTDEETERDEKLKKALEAMKKGKKDNKADAAKAGGKDADPKSKAADEKTEGKDKADDKKEDEKKVEQKKDDEKTKDVQIDFDGIFDRVDRLRYNDSSESSLIWIEDGSTLAFSATIEGKRGFFSVKFPRPEKPKKIADAPLSQNRWIKDSKEFVGHKSGVPATMNTTGKTETFAFDVRSERDWREVRKIVFDQGCARCVTGFMTRLTTTKTGTPCEPNTVRWRPNVWALPSFRN